MPRFAHLGDLHVTEGSRLAESRDVLTWIRDDIHAHDVDAVLVGGDLWGTVCPHRPSDLERIVVEDLLQGCAERTPTLVIPGNHDPLLSIEVVGRLRGVHPILLVDTPRAVDLGGGRVYCLPFPSKRFAVGSGAIGGDLTSQKAAIEAAVRTMLMAWRLDAEAARAAGIATIGLMHVNIGGSVVGGGEVLVGYEIELAPHDLTELGLDAGCLSHIHRHQEMAPGWWFAGAPTMQNHGEESYEPGYHLIDVESGKAPVFTRRLTPARRLITVENAWVERDGVWQWRDDPDFREVVGGAEVRLRVTVPEQARATCPMGELEALLRADGAASVVVDPRIVPTVRVRSEAIRTAVTDEDKLRAYWQSLGDAAPSVEQQARCLARLVELRAPAEPSAEGVAA